MDTIKKCGRRAFIQKGLGYALASGCCAIFEIKKPSLVIAAKNLTNTNISKEYPKKENGLKMKCKITVLKRMFNKNLAEKYCQEPVTRCPVFTEGQEFIYDHSGDGNKPNNFCEHAWNDIYPTVMTLAYKGTFFGWMKEEGTNIVCCTDGIRPVVFKINRISKS